MKPEFTPRFAAYFAREVAEKAAAPLNASAEIEFRISDSAADPKAGAASASGSTSVPGKDPLEIFTFQRQQGKNAVRTGPANDPQIVFVLPVQAAEEILADPSTEIGALGIGILKLIVTSEASRKVSIQLKAGFLTLWNKGYFGVIAVGGAPFASFLASKGLNGIGAIKDALKKARS